jgi:hypothetical protein
METLRKFRVATVRAAVGVTLVAALVAYPFSPVVAQSIALGGVGGTIVFWIQAKRLEKLASAQEKTVNFLPIRSTLLRMCVYALVLYKAYTLDPVAGLIAAVGGLFIVRMVVIFFAFSGLDLKQGDA